VILVGPLAGGGAFAVGDRHFPGGDVSPRSAHAAAQPARERLATALGRAGWRIAKPAQVHGVLVHEAAGIVGHPPDGDGVVCRPGDAAVGMVVAADCVPIAIGSSDGSAAAVHAGWRGLVAGVVAAAGAALARAGDHGVDAVVGPCIEPCCYEFSSGDVDVVAAHFGDAVRARTRGGAPALDLRATAAAALQAAGIAHVRNLGGCTSCNDHWFSWRARREEGRHALMVAAR
jgi:YfiH family protein